MEKTKLDQKKNNETYLERNGIVFNHVYFKYAEDSSRELLALDDVNLTINLGDYTAVVGHTGSGKSTLIQHMNALLKPTNGHMNILGTEVFSTKNKKQEKNKRKKQKRKDKKKKSLNHIRQKVGLVFQFPEYQLFEETIEKDIMFGPMNFGVSKEEAKKIASHVIEVVGLSKELLQKSPLNLSGGQMRRVAIAGILAMDPDILILDEPTAGLDPNGQNEMMKMFYNLYKEHNKTIILITHDMNQVHKYANRVIVMSEGKIVNDDAPANLFKDPKMLKQYELGLPDIVKIRDYIEQTTGTKLDPYAQDSQSLATDLINKFKK
ncbi:energy-coupling factor transporter ATPase [Haloplasma contractile]|uniref:Energy-coupling factor transporter ATP-binding protein EcfA2 n=1 Tax=Haloplasma contractile SSD-17B TaxID=1033810 RepID=U2DVE3_9MOLU|nr:energy-coupling factor transporter ATPase [Haloplasma contractile]ERJ12357.1 Energy-coupling factor transporter ATP-binding protein EcfA 2 [Haloplasma contractile SSD-17B]